VVHVVERGEVDDGDKLGFAAMLLWLDGMGQTTGRAIARPLSGQAAVPGIEWRVNNA
jgi:hypothetical protein